MANTKTINTRIKNRFDTLTNWQADGVELLPGEIALVQVPTGGTYTNPVTGESKPVTELLMKVGEEGKTFDQLPWLSAKAADVYNWAKKSAVEDVEVKVISGTGSSVTTTSKKLSVWAQQILDVQAACDANESAVETLNKDANTEGSVAHSISTELGKLISTEIDKAANTIVKSVTQANGQVTVTYGDIMADELPDISSDKIIVSTNSSDGTNTYLDEKLTALDAAIDANTVASSEETITGLISTALNSVSASDPVAESNASDTFISNISQTAGVITATKKKLPEASSSVAGIVKLGTTGGAATYDAIYGEGGINAQITDLDARLDGLDVAIKGGVHFIGTTTTVLEDGATTSTIIINESAGDITYNLTAENAGNVVIYKENIGTATDPEYTTEREFIWTGSFWEELGHVSRIGTLEDRINNLAHANVEGTTAGTGKFVSSVTQSAGAIAVKYAQPSSQDITHTKNSTDTTVKAELDDLSVRLDAAENLLEGVDGSVSGSIADALAGLTFSDPATGTDTASEFIDTISQTDGKISATKKKLPTATTTAAGIVQLSDTCSGDVVETTDSTTAATTKAIKTVNAVAVDASARVDAVQSNYVRFDEGKLYVGSTGTEVIIFDCGGAANL
jgi:hypothetical protein